MDDYLCFRQTWFLKSGILDCKNTNQFQRFRFFEGEYMLMVVNHTIDACFYLDSRLVLILRLKRIFLSAYCVFSQLKTFFRLFKQSNVLMGVKIFFTVLPRRKI